MAMVYYARAENLKKIRSQFAKEKTVLNFGADIISIVYGNETIVNQTVLDAVYEALANKTPFQVSNASMGGVDPIPDITKHATFNYWSGGKKCSELVREGNSANWSNHY
jgi:alcohol dehydrogenase YqhD (iron-dependent ADH family)